MSHAIWARFPDSGFGRAAEWLAVHLLRSERAARRHSRVELDHFKRVLEREPTPSPDVGEGASAADLQVSAHLEIAAPPEAVWELLSDPERWWVASNPKDHESLEVLTDERPIPEGARLRICERVAGIPCVAEGPVVERIEGRRLSWTARARYRLLGLGIPIDEGVTWEIGPRPEGSVLAAHVWARFPEDWKGRLVRWLFEGPLRGPERDRQHALRELSYLKERLESECAATREASGPADAARGGTS